MESNKANDDNKWVQFKEKFEELYETAKQRKKDNTEWELPGNVRLYTDVMHGFWASGKAK